MLDVRQASFYVGLSPTAFLTRVQAGRYPQGEREGARVLWDRKGIDAILDARAGLGGGDAGDYDAAEEARILEALRGNSLEPATQKAKAHVPIDPAAFEAHFARWDERSARNAAVDRDPETIERILAAREAGETAREIGAREGLTGQKVEAIVRRAKRNPAG